MRPVGVESDGPAPNSFLSPFTPGPLPASEMSLLQSLGPVQSWLGQELEKCGIDAMIYTRYVLSLLLHDSYDYDLQDQENDIFLGWEKGTGKKWGKSKKKGGTDLSLEEMKKQAAVQCLRSASDENSGIESLVEELCSKLKDIQNKQKEEKQMNKKSDGSQSPDLAESPSSKDQVEMYYEAFPPLSEKPVCLQEIMTVWNKAKACAYSSSSSSAVPQTSTDTSSPKDCNSEGEAAKDKTTEACSSVSERPQQRRSKKEKENRYYSGMAEERTISNKRQLRHRCEGKFRPRSWSSGSSEAGSSSSGNQGELKTPAKSIRIRHKSREANRGKKGRNGQVKLALKAVDRDERRNVGGSSSSTGGPPKQQLTYKRGKRPLKESRKDSVCGETKESSCETRNRKEYMEEPLWYTEPITEYFAPCNRRSKLETKYRNRLDSHEGLPASADMEQLSERMQGICIGNATFQRTYLAAGTFVDGHFVEMPGDIDEAAELNGTSTCPPPEDSRDLDDEHLSEFTHFYEVDIYQSILDPSASDSVQESRILSMIRQKSKEQKDFEAECCLVLDGPELQGESAIRADSQRTFVADGFYMQDMENIAQVWECYSSSSSEDIDGESFAGDSPVHLSPVLDSTVFNASRLPGNIEEYLSEANEAPGLNSSCFSLFEVQYDSPTLPFPCDSLTIGHDNTDSNSCLDPLGNKRSRLLIWTKNSAFDETEHCSNLSTRTCSPWSHSEETRSDNEQINVQSEEMAPFGNEKINCIVPSISTRYLEDELLDFLQEDASVQRDESSMGSLSSQMFKKKSKLESICGIPLEQDESKHAAGIFTEDTNQQSENYSSGIIKDIWTTIGDRDSVPIRGERSDEGLFSEEINNYHCCCLDVETKRGPDQGPQKMAVQRLEYHLWEGQNEEQVLSKNELSKVDGGDYMTPSKPWDVSPEKDNTFILGGVYGELKTFGSDGDWAVVPPGSARGSLLQCAAASASDVVTIAGTDVFMNTGSCFAPGHKPLWRPLVSFGQCDQATKGGEDGLNKGFSLIFHEDLLGTCGSLHGEEPGLDYAFSSFDLNNPFSQVLHVECSFEPEDMASFSPGFKPKSILCSDSESESFHPRIYGINRTQYRAIRISPRTHFRPISASELSPGGGSESEAESEKEEMSLPVLAQADVFDDPQADLKPLEEDAECEGPYYGKSELESGKFLPRLKKSGMEKSAQTSLDSQEGSGTLLPIAEQEICLDCETAAPAVSGQVQNSAEKIQTEESCSKTDACQCPVATRVAHFGEAFDFAEDLQRFPLLNVGAQGSTGSQKEECWWQNTLCSPLFPGTQCTGKLNSCTNSGAVGQLEFAASFLIKRTKWTRIIDFDMAYEYMSSAWQFKCRVLSSIHS
uniref:KIAA0232 n=1 Tax=Scleropages formosus TaxID=113540 RepID=A0A8C9SAL9_SCLFO